MVYLKELKNNTSMKTITIRTNYQTQWGETLHIVGSSAEIGNWDQDKSLPLEYIGDSSWKISFNIDRSKEQITFKFIVKQLNEIVNKEQGEPHAISLSSENTSIKCMWRDKVKQNYFRTSIFKNSVFKHKYEPINTPSKNEIQLLVNCIHAMHSQELVLLGNSEYLGKWSIQDALPLTPSEFGIWSITISRANLNEGCSYKLAIREKESKEIVEWEEGGNRFFSLNNEDIEEIIYRKNHIEWRTSGVAIPIFSLRSNRSFGVGEFSDLNLLIDWAAASKMSIIQVLPINDTSATNTWLDSYPYNAISIYALHPLYLGLHQYPLKSDAKNKKYLAESKALNTLDTVDYAKVIELKTKYLSDLFSEIGKEILSSKEYQLFWTKNNEWLFPYACFCHLKEQMHTTRLSDWGEFEHYDKKKLIEYTNQNAAANENLNKTYFIQYLLHKQLTEAKEYAYSKGVVLKGDIPIGISPNSVEAWTEPHLFNLDTQTGAPPDDFSVNGQNWGFPTYNWMEMRQDNYSWWTKRFTKMADYFDAYRIDHILGFFRIWEIPKSSVYGLLGYFSPALPLSIDEIKRGGVKFHEQMTVASTHQEDLSTMFGDKLEKIINLYLQQLDEGWYILKEEYNTQRKIQAHFHEKDDTETRDALYSICNEVLFIKDKNDSSKYHPRISIQNTLRYKHLSKDEKHALDNIYDDYFYHRHSQFWRDEAMKKLPTLIESTNMLVCGEDLGMVPNSVPSVMNDLQILSLEIQRMPKQLGVSFGDLSQLPYLSVATTSTHDMPPIRKWWKENLERTQSYFHQALHLNRSVPKDCNTALSLQIMQEHLKSPAMLTILPLQDWLAISDKLKRKDEQEEQINVPSNPHHNWNYRMHLTLEDLIAEREFSDLLKFLNEESGR